MIRIGDLRHRVMIQKDGLSDPTSTGQRDVTYTDFLKVWAEIKTLQGRELDLARNVTATVTHTVHIRYVPNLLNTYRILWVDKGNNRILQINAVVDPDNRRAELFLYCTEEVA